MSLDTLADDQKALLKRMGARLRVLRERQEMTQQEVADGLEITRATIANIEGGRSNISVTRLYDLALVYRVTVDEILF